jgi:hypothetical protein
MLLGRFFKLPVLVAILAFPLPASAGWFSSLFRPVGRGLAAGAVEQVEPALARTLADADARMTKHENQIEEKVSSLIGQTSKEAGDLLDQTSGILEKRILQVQLGADEILDRGLNGIDKIAKKRISQIDQGIAARIDQIDSKVKARLEDVDKMLVERIANVDQVVSNAIGQADVAIAARIVQLDEVAGRRLGNVDVIATKQRLGLETTITRAAWLLALIVFVVFLLRGLWTEYVKADLEAAKAEAGARRARVYARILGLSLMRHAAVGTAVAVLLATIPSSLPSAASKQLESVTAHHATAMQTALTELDWTRVRFHAAQLEMLQPTGSVDYRAMAAKADLLQDLLGRATALESGADAASVLARVQAFERIPTGRCDPDVQTVRAMLIWREHDSKRKAHVAASLAARALWGNARGFVLAPMAQLIVQAYLDAPEPQGWEEGQEREQRDKLAPDNQERLCSPPVDPREMEPSQSLMAALKMAITPRAGSPFEGAFLLFQEMRKLQKQSNEGFVTMIKAQSEVSRSKGEAQQQAMKTRTQAAEGIVQAWQAFDNALLARPSLSNDPLVLSVFRLNDVQLTHALWFTSKPDRTDWPRKLATMSTPADLAMRPVLAAARPTWARRYAGLMTGPARTLVEMQEARRFVKLEEATLDVERAFATPGCASATIKNGCSASNVAELQVQLQGASAAAALDLYQGEQDNRQPVAQQITGGLASLRQRSAELAAEAQRAASKALRKGKEDIKTALDQKISQLRQQLLGRG